MSHNTSSRPVEKQIFDFNEWIDHSNLTEVKDLFEQHGAVTLQTLKLKSSPFKSLLADSKLHAKPHFMPVIFEAVRQLPKQYRPNKENFFCIVSDEEHVVMDNIEDYQDELDDKVKIVAKCNKTYPDSENRLKKRRLDEVNATREKVNVTFDSIERALKQKKASLLSELSSIERQINKFDPTNTKQTKLIRDSEKKIKTERIMLDSKLAACKHKLRATGRNNRRQSRKKEILKIGDDVNNKWLSSKKILDRNIDDIQTKTTENNATFPYIDFVINGTNKEKTIKEISNLGRIVNEPHRDKNKRGNNSIDNKNVDDPESDHDKNNNEQEIREYKKQITELNITMKNMTDYEKEYNVAQQDLKKKDEETSAKVSQIERLTQQNSILKMEMDAMRKKSNSMLNFNRNNMLNDSNQQQPQQQKLIQPSSDYAKNNYTPDIAVSSNRSTSHSNSRSSNRSAYYNDDHKQKPKENVTWNTKKHGKHLKFIDSNTVKMTREHDRYAICLINTLITNNKCSKFKITFKISGEKTIRVYLGYVTSNKSIKNWDESLGRNENKDTSFGLHVSSSYDQFGLYDKDNNGTKLKYKSISNFKSGDLFICEYDFDQDILQMYHNKSKADSIPLHGIKKIIPGISMDTRGNQVQIVSVEYF